MCCGRTGVLQSFSILSRTHNFRSATRIALIGHSISTHASNIETGWTWHHPALESTTSYSSTAMYDRVDTSDIRSINPVKPPVCTDVRGTSIHLCIKSDVVQLQSTYLEARNVCFGGWGSKRARCDSCTTFSLCHLSRSTFFIVSLLQHFPSAASCCLVPYHCPPNQYLFLGVCHRRRNVLGHHVHEPRR